MFSANFIPRSFYLSAGLGLLALLSMPAQLVAQTGKSLTSFDNICLAEAKRAETRHGIPSGLLQSITRVESGRKMITGEYMPWAWTLNDRGEGLFFDDREAALAYLRNAVAKPEHSVDVGCMQVNTKWHADGFPDLADMLDPVHNASYAAGFLLDLHAAHQSWDEAVKHYHSSEPRKNVSYHRRVLAELERFMGDGDMADDAPLPALPGEAAEVGVEMTAARATNRPMPQTPAASPSSIEVGSTDLELITGAPAAMPTPLQQMASPAPHAEMHGRDSLAPDSVPPSAAPSSAVPSAAMPRGDKPVAGRVASQTGEDDSLLEKQPNLAPHRSRVEHFRRLLAQQAG